MEQSAGSDVDVMIIGAIDFGAVIDALHPVQRELGREINPEVFSVREWETKLVARNAFILDVLDKPKIFLLGGKDELEELGGRQS